MSIAEIDRRARGEIHDGAERGRARASKRRASALLARRDRRVKPFRDEKILATWNGLLVSSLADASRALSEPRWLELAERTFDFVWTHLRKGDRIVRHAEQPFGFLDDHAFVACAALDLHEATAKPEYLEHARALSRTIREAFMDDKETGALYLAPKDGEALIARTQDVYDHAVPSATSKALELCARLGEDVQGLGPLARAALDNPFGLSSLVLVADRVRNESTEITFTNTDPQSERR